MSSPREPASRRVGGISVVVPVYNSDGSLDELLRRLAAVLPEACDEHEIILVDDGSRDGSWNVVAAAAARDHRVRGIRLMRNFGQHNALLVGVRNARLPLIVTLDDDLQNPPEEIPRLLGALQEGSDVVYGFPAAERHGVFRRLASRATKFALEEAMGAPTARSVSAFRMFRTDVRKAFDRYQSPYISLDVLLTWGTTRFAAVPVRQDDRAHGASNYTFRRLVTHAVNMITGFTTRPLRAASLMGFFFTLLGFALLAYVLIRYAANGFTSVPGFPFLASIICLFSGTQLLILGIMGEYLARMHFRLLERPAYVIAETTSEKEPTA